MAAQSVVEIAISTVIDGRHGIETIELGAEQHALLAELARSSAVPKGNVADVIAHLTFGAWPDDGEGGEGGGR